VGAGAEDSMPLRAMRALIRRRARPVGRSGSRSPCRRAASLVVCGPADRLPDRGDVVEHVLRDVLVVDVGGGDDCMQRQPVALSDRLDLQTAFAAVDRARPGQVPSLTARTCVASMLALDQSIRPATPSTSRVAWYSAAITPCCTHPLNRRCALADEIGNDSGSSFHAHPVSSRTRSRRARPSPRSGGVHHPDAVSDAPAATAARGDTAHLRQYFSTAPTPLQRMTLIKLQIPQMRYGRA
jgi:hypothetical protein